MKAGQEFKTKFLVSTKKKFFYHEGSSDTNNKKQFFGQYEIKRLLKIL